MVIHFQDPTGHNAHMLMAYLPNDRILVTRISQLGRQFRKVSALTLAIAWPG
jgi:hypothetical protein